MTDVRLFRQSVAEVIVLLDILGTILRSYEKPKELLLRTLDVWNIYSSFFPLMPLQIHYQSFNESSSSTNYSVDIPCIFSSARIPIFRSIVAVLVLYVLAVFLNLLLGCKGVFLFLIFNSTFWSYFLCSDKIIRYCGGIQETVTDSSIVAYFSTSFWWYTKGPILFWSVQITMWHRVSYLDISYMLLFIFFFDYWKVLILVFY